MSDGAMQCAPLQQDNLGTSKRRRPPRIAGRAHLFAYASDTSVKRTIEGALSMAPSCFTMPAAGQTRKAWISQKATNATPTAGSRALLRTHIHTRAQCALTAVAVAGVRAQAGVGGQKQVRVPLGQPRQRLQDGAVLAAREAALVVLARVIDHACDTHVSHSPTRCRGTARTEQKHGAQALGHERVQQLFQARHAPPILA